MVGASGSARSRFFEGLARSCRVAAAGFELVTGPPVSAGMKVTGGTGDPITTDVHVPEQSLPQLNGGGQVDDYGGGPVSQSWSRGDGNSLQWRGCLVELQCNAVTGMAGDRPDQQRDDGFEWGAAHLPLDGLVRRGEAAYFSTWMVMLGDSTSLKSLLPAWVTLNRHSPG